MPSHQERISKYYEDRCTNCLAYNNCSWDDESSFPQLCEGCKWKRYIREGNCKMPNENIQRILDRYPLSK